MSKLSKNSAKVTVPRSAAPEKRASARKEIFLMVRPDMPAHFPATAHSCRLELVAGVGCSPASCSCLHGQ